MSGPLGGDFFLTHTVCVRVTACVSTVKRYSMALHTGELQTLSIFELLEYIVSEVSLSEL